MPYKYKEKFLKDEGYRFFRDKRSILVQMLSCGRVLDEPQLSALARHFNEFLDDVLRRDPRALIHRSPLAQADFPELKSEPLFKYVSDSTWEYIKEGSIQLGTADYYRSTPNIHIRDQREGASMFHLGSGDRQLHVAITSGFNCALFCGTGYADGPVRQVMQSRFGRNVIRIHPLDMFINRIGKQIGAFHVRVYDCVYTDLKNFVASHAGVRRFYEIAGGKSTLDRKTLREINELFFALFYEYGFLPSLFSKPTIYAEERERRIAFEMRDDLKKPTLVVKDRSLLDCIALVSR